MLGSMAEKGLDAHLAFPVSNVGGTFASNIGTISNVTVKDILGN